MHSGSFRETLQQHPFVSHRLCAFLSADFFEKPYIRSSLKSTEDINALPFDLTIEDTSLEVLFKDNDEDIQMIKNLQEAYKQLSENQRMAIYLRYIKGLSYREVAAVLEINPQSAMNLVSRTLTSLRSKMTLKEYLFFLPFFLS